MFNPKKSSKVVKIKLIRLTITLITNAPPLTRGTSRDVKQQRLGQARQEATQVREEYDAGVRANPYAGVLPTRHPPAPAAVHPTYSPGSDGIPHRVLPPPTCHCYLKGATATPRHSFHRSHQLHSSPASPSPVNSDLGNLTSCPSYFRV